MAAEAGPSGLGAVSCAGLRARVTRARERGRSRDVFGAGDGLLFVNWHAREAGCIMTTEA